MNRTAKRLVVAGAIAAGVMTLGAGAIFAAEAPSQSSRIGNLVSAIATRFNLNPSDVQKVFDDQRAADQAQMQAKRADAEKARLAKLVTDGKLTQAQSDAITAKMAEVQTFMASLAGKTPAERQSAMKAERDSLTQWAKDNGIPDQYLLRFGDGMRGPGFMGGMMRGPGGRGHGMGPGSKDGATGGTTASGTTQS